MAKGIDTGNHPKRRVGREDYHTNTVEDAATFARNNPDPMDEATTRRIALSGGPGWRQAARDLGEYGDD